MKEKNEEEMYKDERWLPVVGFEGIYDVSDFGRVRSIMKRKNTLVGRILKPSLNASGYRHVGLHKDGKHNTLRVHRLAMMAFIGPCPNGEQINHIDGNKINNRLDNLEYVTASENTRHALSLGLRVALRGEAHCNSKLKETDVHKIRALFGKKTHAEIAEIFNVSRRNISHIANGSTWGWLKEEWEE